MLVNRMATLCKKGTTINIYLSKSGEQWIGNTHGMYPAYNLPPELEEEHIFAIFNYSRNQRESTVISHSMVPEKLSIDDDHHTDNVLDPPLLTLTLSGRSYAPYLTQQGLLLMDLDYLTPIPNKDGAAEVYERLDSTGQVYFVVKRGLMVAGLIYGHKVDKFTNKSIQILAEASVLAREFHQSGEDEVSAG